MGIDIDLNVGDIRHPTLTSVIPIRDKYVGLKNVILISEVFRYRHQSSFRYPTMKKKIITLCEFEPAPLEIVSKHYNTKLLCLSV